MSLGLEGRPARVAVGQADQTGLDARPLLESVNLLFGILRLLQDQLGSGLLTDWRSPQRIPSQGAGPSRAGS